MDETADQENCQCKFCASDEAQRAFLEIEKVQQQKLGLKPEEPKPVAKTPVLAQSKSTDSVTPAAAPKLAVDVPKKPVQPNLPQPTSQSQSQSPAPTAQLAQTPIVKPTPPVQATNSEQVLDSQPNKFMFRPGEVVWYQRNSDRGGAVGLAVVTARELLKDLNRTSRAAYNVQPLSHPFHHPPAVLVRDEQHLKPWLAFSPPENFHESLRKINISFQEIPWRQILDGVYGEGDTEADGSIFAAKTADASYTPFDVVSQTPTETKYNGVFLGGEKIWRGEALRLKQGNGKDIIILSEIVEKPTASASSGGLQQQQQQQQQPAVELSFVGDIYSYRSNPHPSKQMPRNTYLPARVQQDLEFRNSASMARGKGGNYWKFLAPLARLSIADIKGRWYESRNMIPILHGPDALAQAVREGEVEDIGDSLNSRGDSSAIVAPDKRRRATRLDAFGLAVPQGTVFGGSITPQVPQQVGMQAPIQQPQQPQQQQQRMQEQRHQQSVTPQPQGYPVPGMQQAQQQQPPQQQPQQDTEMTDYVGVNQMHGEYQQGYMG